VNPRLDIIFPGNDIREPQGRKTTAQKQNTCLRMDFSVLSY
jgi:hypothetical protein